MKIDVLELARQDDHERVMVVLTAGGRVHRKVVIVPEDVAYRKAAIRKAVGDALKDELYEACPEGRHLWCFG